MKTVYEKRYAEDNRHGLISNSSSLSEGYCHWQLLVCILPEFLPRGLHFVLDDRVRICRYRVQTYQRIIQEI